MRFEVPTGFGISVEFIRNVMVCSLTDCVVTFSRAPAASSFRAEGHAKRYRERRNLLKISMASYHKRP